MKTNPLNTALEQLCTRTDLVSTKSALLLICSEFGSVKRLDVLLGSQGNTRQALCFLRMENSEQEQQVMRFLEVARFDGDLVIVVDMPSPVPTKHVQGRHALRSVANC